MRLCGPPERFTCISLGAFFRPLTVTGLPDLILMDINLPGISGFDAMKLIRAGPTTAHIPVVAVSANAMPLDVERGLKAGFFRYITKPIRVSEFMEAVNIALAFADRTPKPESGS